MDRNSDRLLEQCRDEVEQLKAENEALRDSAETFGALAERLNQPAFAERRAYAERRQLAREAPDRRGNGLNAKAQTPEDHAAG